MPNFKSIPFEMTDLWGRIESAPTVCVIQKTPCGIGLSFISVLYVSTELWQKTLIGLETGLAVSGHLKA